jgi:hypothetical protein
MTDVVGGATDAGVAGTAVSATRNWPICGCASGMDAEPAGCCTGGGATISSPAFLSVVTRFAAGAAGLSPVVRDLFPSALRTSLASRCLFACAGNRDKTLVAGGGAGGGAGRGGFGRG